MARGAGALQNTLTGAASKEQAAAESLRNRATSLYEGIIGAPGFTPEQINMQTEAATTPVAAQGTSAQDTLAQRAARTRNTAGLVAGQRAIASGVGRDLSSAAWGVRNAADKTALEERDRAIAGMSSLYAPTIGSSDTLYGNAVNANRGRTGFNLDLGPFGKWGAS
jgi:hypothetical protein